MGALALSFVARACRSLSFFQTRCVAVAVTKAYVGHPDLDVGHVGADGHTALTHAACHDSGPSSTASSTHTYRVPFVEMCSPSAFFLHF